MRPHAIRMRRIPDLDISLSFEFFLASFSHRQNTYRTNHTTTMWYIKTDKKTEKKSHFQQQIYDKHFK